MIRRPPRSTQSRSSAASDVYKRQIQSFSDIFNEGIPVTGNIRLWSYEYFGCRYTFFFHGGQASGKDCLPNQGQRHTFFKGCNRGPFACAFLPGGIQYLVNDRLTLFILIGQNVSRDLNQIAVEVSFIPFFKHCVHFIRCETQVLFHQKIGLADQLHVTVFDAVVHHFNKVAGTVFSDPFTARASVNPGSDCLKNRFDQRPRLHRSTGHNTWPLQRTFFAAGHTGTDIQETFTFNILCPADGIREMRVPSVNDHITFFEMQQQELDKIIDRLPGPDHHHDLPRLFNTRSEFSDGVSTDDIPACSTSVDEVCNFVSTSVIYCYGESLAFHIHHKILTHYCQTDQANICLIHKDPPWI